MADTNEEELSMEEILSSIKGILSEGEEKAEAPKEEVANREETDSQDEDVYDLSASMIVDVNQKTGETTSSIDDKIEDFSQNQTEELPTLKETETLEPETEKEDISVAEESVKTSEMPMIEEILKEANQEGITKEVKDISEVEEIEKTNVSLLNSEGNEVSTTETKDEDFGTIDVDSEPIYMDDEDYVPSENKKIGSLEVEEINIDVDSEPIYEEGENRNPIDIDAEDGKEETAELQNEEDVSVQKEENEPRDIEIEAPIDIEAEDREEKAVELQNEEDVSVQKEENEPRDVEIENLIDIDAEDREEETAEVQDEEDVSVQKDESESRNMEIENQIDVEVEDKENQNTKHQEEELHTPVIEEKQERVNVYSKKEEKNEIQDVSSEIIDNFAQMFNGTNSQSNIPVATKQTLLGDGNLTIETLLKEVIAESIKPVVEEAVSKLDDNILQAVKEEISVVAKEWVNQNLQNTIEEVVKEEVRRVIAKVGS